MPNLTVSADVDAMLAAADDAAIRAAIGAGTGNGDVTLAGAETLSNKTIASPVFSGTTSGTFTIGGTVTFPSAVVTLTGTQTLTNKTLTNPTVTDGTFTGTQSFSAANVTTVTAETLAFNRTLGTDDTYRGTTITGINAGYTAVQWDAVYYDFTAGEWLAADANGTGTYPAQGLAVAASTDGAALTVMTQGFVRNDAWTWAAGPIYLSGTSAGLTQTAPATSGDKVQVVGFAVTADVAYFSFDPTYVTVA